MSDSDDEPNSASSYDGYSSDSMESASDPPNVVLAKIFTITPDPQNLQKTIIAEWDGTDPGPTKALFVHVCIDNTTYTSYVSVGQQKIKQRKANTIMGRPYVPDYDRVMQNETPKQGLISCLHNPKACSYPGYTELGTLLPNLMCGILSFENERDRHRIFMFYTPPSPGLTSYSHSKGTKPEFSYWYKLNNLSGQDKETEPDLGSDKIRRVSKNEFGLYYQIFHTFNPDNPVMHNLYRELGKRKPGILGKRSRGGKKHSKKRNKTRRKYRKIKSRRRRVMR